MNRWDQDKIVAALLDRKARGLALNSRAIRKSDQPLCGAIRKHFPSHDAALLAAGIDPASARKVFPRDAAKVVSALRARRDAGLALNGGTVIKADPRLYSAAYKKFGSYAAALSAAGIDPETVRMKTKWDKARITAALRDRQARGLALNGGTVVKADSRLYSAAYKEFGSYAAALSAAGIDPETVSTRARWDKARIVAALRDRRARGLALNGGAVVKADPRLYSAAYKQFGSYAAALRAAGIDPEAVRVKTRWNKARIVAALGDRQARGLALNGATVVKADAALYGAASRHFGSYPAALRAAGIGPGALHT